MKLFKLLSLLLLVLLSACGNRNKENLEVETDAAGIGELVIADEAMDEVIQNIASPIEVAALLNDLDVPFSSAYLADPDGISTHSTNNEMAWALGVLSSDLGYLNMYNKTGTAINFLSTINRLSEALDIGQFFDFVLMKRLATTESNLDSLLFVSMNSFNNMDDHLRETDRSSLSSLMVAGVWVEGLHLATQVYGKTNHSDIRTMIAEQKVILNDLIIILENYASEPMFADLLKDFYTMKKIYDDVEITYIMGEPETVEVDGMLMVVQNETTKIDMSDEVLSSIVDVTATIRNKHLTI
jgi:hypothetical protein